MYVFCFLFLGAVVAVTRSKEGRDYCVFCGRSGCSLQMEEPAKKPQGLVLPFSGQGC